MIDPELNLIVKANDLVNSRYELSLTECRIVEMALSQIEPNDTQFREYDVNLRELMLFTQSYSENFYYLVKEASKRLVGRVLDIPKPANGEDGFLIIPLVNRVEYLGDLGVLRIGFDRELKPFLLQLKENFTQYERMYILQLGSVYATRLYQYLKQMPFIPIKELEVEELKRRLCLEEKYKNYNDFKKRVIVAAQREINQKTDIEFDFEEIKQQKKVCAVRFVTRVQDKRSKQRIPPLPGDLPALPDGFTFERPQDEPLSADLVDLVRYLDLPLDEVEMRSFVVKFGEEQVLDALCYLLEQAQQTEIKRPVPYLHKTLDMQYGRGYYRHYVVRRRGANAYRQTPQHGASMSDADRLATWHKSDEFAAFKQKQFRQHYASLKQPQLAEERTAFEKFLKTFPLFRQNYFDAQNQLIPDRFVHWVGSRRFRDEQLFAQWIWQTHNLKAQKINEIWTIVG